MIEQQIDVVYIPGLKDHGLGNRFLNSLLPYFWDSRGFPMHIISPDWHRGPSFIAKLQLILGVVDPLIAEGKNVAVVGLSAGGSAAVSTFFSRREKMVAAINVAGRLRRGQNVSPTLEQASRYSTAFRQSVLHLETDIESALTQQDRKRIMTVRPRWLDRTVPASTVSLEGATNLVRSVPGHVLGGGYIMTFGSRDLQNFISSKTYGK